VYWTVYPVSLLFADLLSLHLVTFSMFCLTLCVSIPTSVTWIPVQTSKQWILKSKRVFQVSFQINSFPFPVVIFCLPNHIKHSTSISAFKCSLQCLLWGSCIILAMLLFMLPCVARVIASGAVSACSARAATYGVQQWSWSTSQFHTLNLTSGHTYACAW